jgi:LCP family protein required for cell wall assembly
MTLPAYGNNFTARPAERRPLATSATAASTATRPSAASSGLGTASARPAAAKPKRRWRPRFTKKRIVLLLVLIVLVAGIFLGGKLIYNLSRIFNGGIFSAFTTTKLDGEDRGRVNILLAGNSADDPGHQGANLTDSIMIVSLDTRNNTAFMLSIPRDLWVNIPGYGHHKINEAYNDGEQDDFSQAGYPNGGMGQLEAVVEDNFGIDLNYYALINYNAFKEAVDAVGGIDVTIKSTDTRGLYDPNISRAEGGPLKLTNGKHTLDGKTALNLARARGDSYRAYGFPASDFDRTNNQRLMLLALKSKMLSTGVLANPVKLSNLMDALGANVKTDMKLSEVRRLMDLGKKIGNSNIRSLSLNDADGKNLLASYTSYQGESALVPAAGADDFGDIKKYMKKILSTNPVIRENAKVVVLNGTDTFGLAGKNADTLRAKSLNVVDTGDSLRAASKTYIINTAGTSKPATLKLLKSIYGEHVTVTTTNPYNHTYTADFLVVVGDDRL